jgi:hypothetical protein
MILEFAPPPFSLILPTPHCWNSFNRYHFSIYICVYRVFAPYSPSFTISPPPPTGTNPPAAPPGRTCFALLFCIRKEEGKKITFLVV